MKESFKKSILVTGAATGIGASTVKKISNKNVSLTLTTKSNINKRRTCDSYMHAASIIFNALGHHPALPILAACTTPR